MGVVCRWCGWIAALAVLGCFSEAPSAGDGASCDLGSAGCGCDDGACADALACMSELDLCIPAGCDPGTELCTCHAGECFGELRCEGGLCRPPSTGESTVGGDMGSSGGETFAAASTQSEGTDTTAASTTTPGETSATTDATADSGMSTSSASDSGIDGGACHGCVMATLDSGNECEMAFSGCAPNGACTMLVSCVLDALDADDPAGIPGCCEMHDAGAPAYADVATCWAYACAMDCAGFMLACGG